MLDLIQTLARFFTYVRHKKRKWIKERLIENRNLNGPYVWTVGSVFSHMRGNRPVEQLEPNQQYNHECWQKNENDSKRMKYWCQFLRRSVVPCIVPFKMAWTLNKHLYVYLYYWWAVCSVFYRLLCSLMTVQQCTGRIRSYSINNNDESVYRQTVQQLLDWCTVNDLGKCASLVFTALFHILFKMAWTPNKHLYAYLNGWR